MVHRGHMGKNTNELMLEVVCASKNDVAAPVAKAQCAVKKNEPCTFQ